METLANLESFVRSAECRSFSEAARRLSITPAAVSRNVAVLERNLGVRLFHRSTRKLTLTEAGERFQQAISQDLENLKLAIANIVRDEGQPAGTLKVSLPPTIGLMYILPKLSDFMGLYPLIRLELHFDARQVDLVAEGYDAAVGGGFDLAPNLVARKLTPAHMIAVAAASYLLGRDLPVVPTDLAVFDGILLRVLSTGRVRQWTMRDVAGRTAPAPLRQSIVVNDPIAMRDAALLGLGVILTAVPDVLPALSDGTLVRLLPDWYADAGSISVYYASRDLLPAKTRAFVEWVADVVKTDHLAERFAGISS